MTEQTPRGSLSVNVRTAGGAIPVPGAIVTVSPSTEDGGSGTGIIYSLLSGEDGSTPVVFLDAPPSELSFEPNNSTTKPFSEYVVTVTADGFYVAEAPHIPIFAGVRAVLPVELIPLAEFGDSGVYRPSVDYADKTVSYGHLNGMDMSGESRRSGGAAI